ncbi:hypothetical protein SEENIN0B_01354 [Salmonella enterica subsp. enterica serovar Infantis str. SARB27]|uniref:Uncharacterized protein n=5 Tax=Salmonella enterica TaxID=28901 RepID=M7SHG5_SALDU|nr:hypothetical protein SEENIN0B_01354 [Salmonella enterica subsp. enterica serovar Infantis str. SARB27]EMR54335.1 hypothetical protein A670_00443 [Salmonella enterica subsp. enterica serovar Dublin str. UC16]EPI74624.1 hypothetical protein A673_01060 [Salmonella enterica subsp. enterica serovar Enteritidis str. 2009K0958]EPI75411.1 hypothetical protein A671_00600 [Salmonella enterica subsp. enterica serovar Dublin str. DG22]EPI76210.1 hypothetical protein A672_00970 [Salmonella enterica subsp
MAATLYFQSSISLPILRSYPMNNQPLRVSKDQPRKPDKTPEDEGKNPKKNQK